MMNGMQIPEHEQGMRNKLQHAASTVLGRDPALMK
jgi:hypothetical protein